MSPKGKPNPENSREEEKFPGYPHYDGKEDIYKNEEELDAIDPENPTRKKDNKLPANEPKELDFNHDKMGDDLDVPGAELDDNQEDIGSEDEENNYYSLGGDNHED